MPTKLGVTLADLPIVSLWETFPFVAHVEVLWENPIQAPPGLLLWLVETPLLMRASSGASACLRREPEDQSSEGLVLCHFFCHSPSRH